MTIARYTVFGNPIAHSKSPQIHQYFAQQEHVQIQYTRSLVAHTPEAFQAALKDFFEQGGQGANVTLPFKVMAYEYADQLSEQACTAGAVNTLIRQQDGTLRGDNTDGIGLVHDLTHTYQLNLNNKRILILGAGGAARGIIAPLLAHQPNNITIANRSHAKAQQLAQQFNIHAATFTKLSGSFDVIINATSGSLNAEVPPIPHQLFANCQMAYDLFYARHATAFMQTAAQYGAAQTADGLGMLVCQAAQAYTLWRGFQPETASVIAALRKEMIA